MRTRLCVVSFLLMALAAPSRATVLDPSWTETVWFSEPSSVTGMAWAPDGSGRLFVIHKAGQVRIVNYGPPPSLVATNFATISPVFTSSECGLIGMAFDPDFVTNGHVYFFVTVSSSEQQVIRYTAVGDTGTDKTILVPGLPTVGANHDGGGVGIGRDGKLYWSIGDQGSGVGVDANLTSLASKVGRANRDGSVPPDNPFDDAAGPNNDYIFARGFRNPYTLTFQPITGLLWVDVAGTQYEQVFAVNTREHAGWNDWENTQPAGFIPPKIKYRTNSTDTRTITPTGAVRSANVVTFTTTANHGFRQGEKIAISGVSDASFNGAFYVASAPQVGATFSVAQVGPDASSGDGSAQTQSQGGAITGGAFYDATGAPAAYRGNFFYGDFNSGRVNRAIVGPGTAVTAVDYFATGNSQAIDVTVGPDGALYYVGHGGTILRTSYNAVSQGLVVSPSHVWMDEGGKGVFTVRLAVAPIEDVTVDVARVLGSSRIDVLSGATLTFTPSDFDEFQTVTIEADFDAGTDAATFAVSSAGLTTESVLVHTINGPVLAYDSPGAVPNGSDAGIALLVGKNAVDPIHDIDLDWDPSCGTAYDYSVHQGEIGLWYSHDGLVCSTNAATQITITPPPLTSHYYLVVPLDRLREGSYGTDSDGAERDRSGFKCEHGTDPTICP